LKVQRHIFLASSERDRDARQRLLECDRIQLVVGHHAASARGTIHQDQIIRPQLLDDFVQIGVRQDPTTHPQ
jgi:ketosteroid isomerase-like protein